MAPVRSIDKGEGQGMAKTCRNEGAFRAPITRIFAQQSSGGETPNAFGSSTGKTVSVEASVCPRSSVPFVRVVIGRVCHAYPGTESICYEAARTKRGLHEIFELVAKVHWLQRPVIPLRQK